MVLCLSTRYRYRQVWRQRYAIRWSVRELDSDRRSLLRLLGAATDFAHGARLTFDSFLEELADESKAPTYSGLVQLSGLADEEATKLDAAWGGISSERKRGSLEKLIELGEENVELDFSHVFRASMEDEDAGVRQRGAQGLWDNDDRTLIGPLADMLLNDPSAEARSAAAMSLGKFAALAHEGKLIRRDSERVLRSLMGAIDDGTEDTEVRRRAIEGVASFDAPEATRAVREAYGSGDVRLIQSAVYAMGQSSNVDWLPTVLEETRSGYSEVRYEAAVAAGKLGDEEIVPQLVHLLLDDDDQVRVAATRALGEVGGQTARRALEHCLTMEDELLVDAAEEVLEALKVEDDPLGYKFDI